MVCMSWYEMRPSAPPPAVTADSSGSGDSAAASVMSAADPSPSGAAAPGREGSSVSRPLFCVFRFYVFTLV